MSRWNCRIGNRRISKSLSLAALGLAAALSSRGGTYASESAGYTMEVLVDGTPLQEYAARGTRYIEALKGREYSVRLCNRTGERVAIALSVDGLNSIDARTTSAVAARKWILGPYETITLDGWQTSAATARRFFFTTEEQSYGAWLGKTKNLGLVAAAVFREKQRVTLLQESDGRRDEPRRQSAEGGASGAPAPEAKQKDSASGESRMRALPATPSDLAATGIGAETSHPVRQVFFDSEDSPAAVLELRYEYHAGLVRLGILPEDGLCPDSLIRRERARGFEEPGFAPDPYNRRQR
jgi:hypothetical protein